MEQNNYQPPLPEQPPQLPYQQVPNYGLPLVRPQVSFVDAIKTCLIEKYCCFKGRARRSEYWNWVLAMVILSVVLGVLSSFLLVSQIENIDINDPFSVYRSPGYIILAVVELALFLPNLGASVRRLHDTGRSGWWIAVPLILYIPMMIVVMVIVNNGNNFFGLMAVFGLFYLIIFIYMIVVLVWLCQDSQPQPNKYGPSPKYQ